MTGIKQHSTISKSGLLGQQLIQYVNIF